MFSLPSRLILGRTLSDLTWSNSTSVSGRASVFATVVSCRGTLCRFALGAWSVASVFDEGRALRRLLRVPFAGPPWSWFGSNMLVLVLVGDLTVNRVWWLS